MTKEIVVQKAAAALTYGGAGGAVLFGLTAYEIGVYGGLLIGLLGLIVKTAVTWHFKAQHQELMREAIRTGQARIVVGDSDAE